MTDSVAVFPPGYRLTDSDTGAPISGATIEFYDAGTTNPKTVYATADLDQGDNPAPLGTSVTTDSLGRPTSDGTAPTDVYVGTAAYKIVIKDADGVTIETKDNRPGAVVSASSVDVSVTATFPVATKSLAYTVVAADQNTTFVVNCSSADVTLTLPSAVTVGNGWAIDVDHGGTANQALLAVASGSGQVIWEGSKSFGGGFALALNGESIRITSDGGNWRVSKHTPPFVKLAQGIIPVTDRVSAAPSSPVQGSLYLASASGTWAGISVTSGNIVQWSGVAWVPFTPYTDCGWIAYVASTNQYWTFQDSAWVTASQSNVGMLSTATQANQEAGSLTLVAVSPGVQQYHPSAAKCWLKAGVSGGTPSINASYNVSSITDAGVGSLSVGMSTSFSSAQWCAVPGVLTNSGQLSAALGTQSSGSTVNITAINNSNNAADPSDWYLSGFGDQ